jgi:hypothetical protein
VGGRPGRRRRGRRGRRRRRRVRQRRQRPERLADALRAPEGLPTAERAFPERQVTPTRQNNYSSTPTDYTAAEKAIIEQHEAYWEAKRKIVEEALCTVNTHCMSSCPMPYVAIKASVTLSNRGYPTEITSIAVDPTWDAALDEFCKALDIKIDKKKANNKKPRWWLVSDWSK